MISRSWMIALLLTALFVRVLILVVRPPLFPPGWGGETASVAMALSTGRGFSDPYWTPSGPTALVPLTYTGLLAAIFSIFGGATPTAGYAAYALNILFSTLVVWPLARLGSTIGGARLGVLAALLWALYPLSGFSDVQHVWSTSLFALSTTLSVLWTIRIQNRTALWEWAAYGALLAFMVLTESVGLVIAGWSILWLFLFRKAPLRYLAVAVVALLLILVPWIVRNSLAFGQPVFLRSNFGLELYEGINYNDLGSIEAPRALPNRDAGELQAFLDLGEIAYLDQKLVGAVNWITDHPAQWLNLVVRRYWAFWTGDAFIVTEYWFSGSFALPKHILFALPGLLALLGVVSLLRQRKPEGWLFAGLLALFPIVYTVASTYPRFRLPIEPLLVLCSSVVLLPLVQPVLTGLGSLAGKSGLLQWGVRAKWSSSDE